jgi:glucose/mannose-6-phosphate isomerase
MLDDLKMIHQRDKSDALGIVEKQWQQLTHETNFTGTAQFSNIENVVYAGMGGSALAALMVQTWPSLPVPFVIIRDYDLPEFVGENTLVICASYSGNTEETLSALAQAADKQAQIVVIAGGGKLQAAAASKGYLLAELPKVVQPRYAVLSNFKVIIDILRQAKLVDDATSVAELASAAQFLQDTTASWRPDVATNQNPAKQIAQDLIGKSVVVYSGPKLYPAAYKWKISINENAKQVAWQNQYPEFNHNEFIGWSKQPVDKPYAIVDLRSNLENERTQKRFDVSERLLSGLRPAPTVVEAEGRTVLEQLLWTAALGDFVSIYTALLNNVDPAPVELVERFKKELG